jgi:AAA family ATP:ADP antiporter
MLYVQIISSIVSLFGTSIVQRYFGIRFCIVGYPTAFAVLSVLIYSFGSSLEILMYGLIVMKALNYTMNQPSKESLYIPTDRETKFKSKAWIDMFGSRMSKSVGAATEAVARKGAILFSEMAAIVPIIISILWIIASQQLGRKYEEITGEI